jgi:hypothetical protein
MQDMAFRGLFDALSLLTPYAVPGLRKVRIGAANDGGYVMIDRFRPGQIVFSYGLSWNIAFELDLAQRGLELFMFDHTIDALTLQHANFHWHKEGLTGQSSPAEMLFTLEDHLDRLAPDARGMILKLDVEGAEWSALANLPIELLSRFEQIVLELHDFRLISDASWRRDAEISLHKLAQTFTLFNVHANNHAPVVIVDGVCVADVIEVSYIRSDLCERRPSSAPFPSYLDAPNDPFRPEIPLWFFPFLPSAQAGETGGTADQIGAAAARFDQTLAQANTERELKAIEAQPAALDAISIRTPPASPGASLKILCISVHPVLEYDEIKLLEEMGHDVFSLGFYFDRKTDRELRPALDQTAWHDECTAAFETMNCGETSDAVKWVVSNKFCALFDVIIVHHNYRFIAANWESLRNSRVVWRTIGQEIHWAEDAMRDFRRRGVKIVRWSPEERYIERYIGSDAVIRAVKDPDDWTGWTGKTRRVVTFNNNFRERGAGMSFDFHQQCVDGLPFDLFGLNNDDVPNWRGVVSAAQQQDILRSYCCAFITGTQPAPYTLGFIEAWMTGIPVVHVGRRRSCADAKGVFEIDHLIVHGENGFLVDDVDQAREIMWALIDDSDLCKRISRAGRASAIEVFGKAGAQQDWSDFLRDHVTC